MKKELIRVGQKVDEVWMTIGQYLVKSWSAFKAKEVGQKLDEGWMDLRVFYPAISLVIQPLSFITHSFIVHNKRVSYGYTKVTPGIHQEFPLFDIAKLFLYVVLPDQNL